MDLRRKTKVSQRIAGNHRLGSVPLGPSPERDPIHSLTGLPQERVGVKRWFMCCLSSGVATPLASYRWEMSPKSEMAGEMAGGHFSGKARNGRKNGRTNGRTGRKWQISAIRPFARLFFRPFRAFPEKWLPAIAPAIFRPFPISGSFPTCSWPMGSQFWGENRAQLT